MSNANASMNAAIRAAAGRGLPAAQPAPAQPPAPPRPAATNAGAGLKQPARLLSANDLMNLLFRGGRL